MRQDSVPKDAALWARPSGDGQSREEALELLEESKALLLAILIGIVMQLRSMDLARCRLLGEEAPGVEELQTGASLLSILALIGFQRQAVSAGDQCEQNLGLISLAIELIRLMRLLYPKRGESPPEEAVELSGPLD